MKAIQSKILTSLIAALCLLGGCKANAQQQSPDTNRIAGLRIKADKGEAEAQSDLGFRYEKGQGVPKDEDEAVKWYRKAADQGHAPAQAKLGSAFANGRGVPKDEVEAVKWFRKATEQGNAAAQSSLGTMYAMGRGVPKDEDEAVKWYRKAAEQGIRGRKSTSAPCMRRAEACRRTRSSL